MMVHTQDRHFGRSGRAAIVGLHIGAVNVQQHFPRHVQHVELELDHLCILCPLEPSFWQDQPEIHDLRLSSWLEAKRMSGKLAPNPAPVAMIPCGERAFRLQVVSKAESEKIAAEQPSLGFVSQVGKPLSAVIPALDRRKFDAGAKPDRRRVARLKSDELPTAAASN